MAYYPNLARVNRFGAIDWSAVAAAATDAFSASLGKSVVSVRVDTALLPPLEIVGGEESTPSGVETFNIGRFLKPKLTIQLGVGNPIVYAPYGDPGEGTWLPLIAFAGAALALAYYAGKKSKR
jgi:hypothetical protein